MEISDRLSVGTNSMMIAVMIGVMLIFANISNTAMAASVDDRIARISSELDQLRDKKNELQAAIYDLNDFLEQAYPFRKEWWEINNKINGLNKSLASYKGTGIYIQAAGQIQASLQQLRNQKKQLLKRLHDKADSNDVDAAWSSMQNLVNRSEFRENRVKRLKASIAKIEEKREALFRQLSELRRDKKASRSKVLEALEKKLKELQEKQLKKQGFMQKLEDGQFAVPVDLSSSDDLSLFTKKELQAYILKQMYDSFQENRSHEYIKDQFKALVILFRVNNKLLKGIISYRLAILNGEINEVKQQIAVMKTGKSGSSASADNGSSGNAGSNDKIAIFCPKINPDKSKPRHFLGSREHFLRCTYISEKKLFVGSARKVVTNKYYGYLKSQEPHLKGRVDGGIELRYKYGREKYYLAYIRNIKSGKSPEVCRYHSNGKISRYVLRDGRGLSQQAVCNFNGKMTKCVLTTHDGRTRGCRADCKDKCSHLRAGLN